MFHIWFIAACLNIVILVQNCNIAHNDLNEGKILIAVTTDQSVSVIFIDFELSTTLEKNPEKDMEFISNMVNNLLFVEIMKLTGMTPNSKDEVEAPVEAPVKEAILKVLDMIINAKSSGNIGDMIEKLDWVLTEIDRDEKHRQSLFTIIKKLSSGHRRKSVSEHPLGSVTRTSRIALSEHRRDVINT